MKAFTLLQICTAWRDEGIKEITNGISNKTPRAQRLRNTPSQQRRSANWHGRNPGNRNSRVFATSLSFLWADSLPPHMALSGDILMAAQPLSSRAAIGLRDFQCQQRPPSNSPEENAKCGFASMRPGFCGTNALPPQQNGPIHASRADILQRAVPRDAISPSMESKYINRISRATLTRLNIPDTDRHSTHSVRMGGRVRYNELRIYTSRNPAYRRLAIHQLPNLHRFTKSGWSPNASGPSGRPIRFGRFHFARHILYNIRTISKTPQGWRYAISFPKRWV